MLGAGFLSFHPYPHSRIKWLCACIVLNFLRRDGLLDLLIIISTLPPSLNRNRHPKTLNEVGFLFYSQINGNDWRVGKISSWKASFKLEKGFWSFSSRSYSRDPENLRLQHLLVA